MTTYVAPVKDMQFVLRELAGLDRLDGQRGGFPRGEVTGRWAPNNGHVDIAVFHRIDDRRWRVRMAVIAIEHVAMRVLHDATIGECMGGWRIGRVGAHHLHADGKLAKPWVVKRSDMQPAVGESNEDIA